MIKIEIKSIFGDVLFTYEKENNTLKATVEEAVRRNANLDNANLYNANLGNANLGNANLGNANLDNANLYNANLYNANLYNANLYNANLYNANLGNANLGNANLGNANLDNANLGNANLYNANLYNANLDNANLRPFKTDMFDVLLRAIPEIKNLKAAIIEGRIDGSTYEGECACLCGTLEKSINEDISEAVHDLRDSSRPIERWFTMIKKGDTPETNQASKYALAWIEEFESLISVK